MKILHVQKIKGIAGSEKGFLTLLPKLSRCGINVKLLCFYEAKYKSIVLSYIGKAKTLNIEVEAHQISSMFGTISAIKVIKKTASSWQADAIHSHLIHADFWCAMAKQLGMKTIIVSTKHGYDESYLAKYGFLYSRKIKLTLYWQIAKFAEKRITKSFAVSEGLSNFYVASKICNPNSIEVIHHGLDFSETEGFDEGETRFGTPQLIIVGRLIEFKGHRFVFDCLKQIKAVHPDFSLVILGEGYLQDNLISIAKSQLCETNVHFLGYQQNISRFFRGSDLKIIPSRAEGFGLVSLEAMHASLPIVGFNVSATNEIVVNNETGILVEEGNSDSLSQMILKLLNNPEKMKEMGRAGKNRLDNHFTSEIMVNKVVEFYKQNIRLK